MVLWIKDLPCNEKLREDHYNAMLRGDHLDETLLCRQLGLSHDINEIHKQNAIKANIPNFTWWDSNLGLHGKVFREVESEMDSTFPEIRDLTEKNLAAFKEHCLISKEVVWPLKKIRWIGGCVRWGEISWKLIE